MSTVEYAEGARPSAGTTLIEKPGPPAAERHPWECAEHAWLEMYRYFAFLNDGPHDTAERPRDEDGKRKKRMDAAAFDVEKNGAKAYTTTPPGGSEIVFQCQRCWHTEAVRLPAAAEKALRERFAAAELLRPHFSTLTLAELMPGVTIAPKTTTIPKPTIPSWVPEQRAMQTRLDAGLAAVEDEDE